MNGFARLLTALFCTAWMAAPLLAAPPSLDDTAALETFVDGLVKANMQANNSPSGTVAITRNGELVFARGYGFQDIEKQIPVDPYTSMFRPGSVSKLFTWVAVMQQVEQGKLDLDTDVNTYLTTFKIRDTFDKPVTLRDIMTHSAGFEDGAVGYLIITDPAKAVPLAEAMERYQPERVNPPGAQTSYSNYATALAGLIVANLSGLSFEDYIQKNILDPLGMAHSTFHEPVPENLAQFMTVSYTPEGGTYAEKPFEIISSFAPAGAESASSVDMVKFAQAILNGGELNGRRILKAETVKEMLSRNFSHDDRLMGMALGFYEMDIEGTRLVGHGGDTQYFHSELGIDQEHGLTFFFSFGGPGGSPVRSSILPAFYQEYFPRVEAPPVAPEDFAERAGKYAGSYNFWRGNFSSIEKALGLAGAIKIAPTEDNTLMVSMGGKVKQYTEVGDNLFRETDAGFAMVPGLSPRLLAFQQDASGNITGFVMDGLPFMSLRKLAWYETPDFNLSLLGIAVLVFLGVLLRRFFQRATIRSFRHADRTALGAAVSVSALNLLTLVTCGIVLTIVKDTIFGEIPLLFKLWLVMPILATLAGLYLLYRTYGVWTQGLLAGTGARVRYTVVALCGLFMCWFYYFWNILGFQYL